MKKSITVVVLTTLVILDEKIIGAEQDDGTSDGELGSDEQLFLFFMFSFFALCVSLFGSFLLYVSFLDDRIMKLYVDEGNLVEGEVVATEFTRGVDTDDENMGKWNSEKKHFVSIEYSILLSENYPIRIRKQLRVLESDFFHPGRNSLDSRDNNDRCPSEANAVATKLNPTIEIIATRDSFFKSFQFENGRKLQLLVLSDHHLSALPACQVERRLSTRYRLFSITFVIAAILIAVFCFRLAAPLLQQQMYEEEEREASGYIPSIIRGTTILNSLLMNFIIAMLALTPVPCIHHLLHDSIQSLLEGEYFEMGGEVIKCGHAYDDSSLSSRSDVGIYNRTTSDFRYSRMGLETQSTLT